MSSEQRRHEPRHDVPPELGKKIQRLRTAYNLSLGELSEQSGVAKSIISQLEKNETNPTLNTIWRISQALGMGLDEVLRADDASGIIEKASKAATPMLYSEDGLCTLQIIGWLETIELVQWYDFHAAPNGMLESEPHQNGSVENLTVLSGCLTVSVGDEVAELQCGETLRFRGDLPHEIRNHGSEPAHATMVNVLKLNLK